MFAPHVPVLISRMRQEAKTGNVTAAGIPVDSDYLHFILQVIIPGMYKARGGDRRIMHKFSYMPERNEIHSDVLAAAAVRAAVRLT